VTDKTTAEFESKSEALKSAGEVWRPVVRNPLYEVSSEGRVRNVATGCVLRPGVTEGYERVVLCSLGGPKKNASIHRLVAEAFFGPSDLTVNHKTGDTRDNSVANLEYATRAENNLHSARTLGTNCGERNPKAKMSWDSVIEMRMLRGFYGMRFVDLARRFGLDKSTVRAICRGDTWRIHWADAGLNS
jgi:hypothetical protein